MANGESRVKISIDEVVESAAAGVLRALDARAAAGETRQKLETRELVASGFFVDFIIRCGGRVGPIDVLGAGKLGQGG
jgi:hypothetical protein